MNKDEFLCPTCGGVLEVIDAESGILKCRNCSNKIITDKKYTNMAPAAKLKENVSIMDSITTAEIKKKNEEKRQTISLKFLGTGAFLLDTLYVICVVTFVSMLLINNIETKLIDLSLIVILVLISNLFAIMAIKIRFKKYWGTIVICIFNILLIISIMVITYVFLSKSYDLSIFFAI